uniref:Uncharacterized protein n=1 Tax=Pipistrellus kuhlii TaxID=59472 RepID=A0A7J7SF45_PIPKU|nr:hypothetical protein mPipKuh1_009996 [Pipistrellus kuhlii]
MEASPQDREPTAPPPARAQGEQTTLSLGQLRLRSWHLWAGHRRCPSPRQCPDFQHGQPVGPGARATQGISPLHQTQPWDSQVLFIFIFSKALSSRLFAFLTQWTGWVMPAAHPTPGPPWGRSEPEQRDHRGCVWNKKKEKKRKKRKKRKRKASLGHKE